MGNFTYEKIYCECLNKCLTVKHYFPVKDFLYKLVAFYDKKPLDEKAFMQKVLTFCDRAIRQNKLEDLDKILNFITILKPDWYDVGDILESVVFPEFYHDEWKSWYFESFRHMTHEMNLRSDISKLGNLKIEAVLKMYKKYHDDIHFYNIFSSNVRKVIYFEKAAPIIIGYFYRLNRDISYLDKIFNDFITNFDAIANKGYLSGICNKEHLASEYGEFGEFDFFSNLVEIDGFNQSKGIN